MATEIQYEVFKAVYDEEAERYSTLEARARLYFSIISLYLGAIAFKAKDMEEFASSFHIPIWWFLLSGAVLVLSLLATIAAIQIRTYEGICDLKAVIRNFGDTPPTDDDFLDDRIVDLAVATNKNSKQNDRTARFLSAAAILLLVSVALHLVIFIAAVASR